MMVSGKQKVMTCSSSSGENARIPLTDSLLMEAILMRTLDDLYSEECDVTWFGEGILVP